jgi:hypothetical protein
MYVNFSSTEAGGSWGTFNTMSTHKFPRVVTSTVLFDDHFVFFPFSAHSFGNAGDKLVAVTVIGGEGSSFNLGSTCQSLLLLLLLLEFTTSGLKGIRVVVTASRVNGILPSSLSILLRCSP